MYVVSFVFKPEPSSTHIQDLANRAVAAVHEILPNPAEGLATTNESLAVGERMVKVRWARRGCVVVSVDRS